VGPLLVAQQETGPGEVVHGGIYVRMIRAEPLQQFVEYLFLGDSGFSETTVLM
jgi:hypothetical protein